jgi:hypothetical protein
MAELKNKAPLMEHNGHPGEKRVLLPSTYITTLAFREKDSEAVMTRLQDMAAQRSCTNLYWSFIRSRHYAAWSEQALILLTS